MIDSRIGQRIQKFRELAGKSQEDLANYVGVSVTSISNIERGANYPSFENFIKILNFIGASPNDVMLDVVDQAQISKASELWAGIQCLSHAERDRVFRVIELILEK